MPAGGPRQYLRDLAGSGWRFGAYELALPFVAYVVAVGVDSAFGGVFELLLSLLPTLVGLAVVLVVLGAIASVWEELLGLGVIVVVGVVVVAAFFAGLEQVAGSGTAQTAGWVVNGVIEVVSLLLTLVLLVALLGAGLVIVGAAAFPFYTALVGYADTYESVDLGWPAAWLVPPALALVAGVAWATAAGLSQVVLVLLFLSVGSLAVRTGLFVRETAPDATARAKTPRAAYSGSLGIGLLTWSMHLNDPGTLQDVRPAIETAYTAVVAVTPFDPAGQVAALTVLAPGVVAAVATVAAHAVFRRVGAPTPVSTVAAWLPVGSGDGATTAGGSGSGGGSSRGATGGGRSSTGGSGGGSGTGGGRGSTGGGGRADWTTVNSPGRGYGLALAVVEVRGEDRLCVAFPYDEPANSALRNSTVDWRFYDPDREAFSPLDGVVGQRCWFAEDTLQARRVLESVFGIDTGSALPPVDDPDATGDTSVYTGGDDPEGDDGTGDTKVWNPDE